MQLIALPWRSSAQEVRGVPYNAGLNVPVLPLEDSRWQRLKFAEGWGVNLCDRFRGTLIGGAIGDAMGRANERVSASQARVRRLPEYQLWAGWQGGPTGTFTDDTQMTVWLAEAMLDAARNRAGGQGCGGAEGQACRGAGRQGGSGRTGNGGGGEEGTADPRDHLVDPDDLARRFTRERIRGIGQATRQFVRMCKDLRRPQYKAGVPSAGNGTAMRAAPAGLLHLGDPCLYSLATLTTLIAYPSAALVPTRNSG